MRAKRYYVIISMRVPSYRTPEMERDSNTIFDTIDFMYDKEGALKLRDDILKIHTNVRVTVVEEDYERRTL